MENKKVININNVVKIPYFDEEAAQDYLDVKNGGRVDWSTTENKEKLGKIVGEIDAEMGGGFNLLTFIKSTFRAKGEVDYSSALSKVIDSRMRNTIMTDYLSESNGDDSIYKFDNVEVYPYPNSFTMYKLFSSYLTIVPKEELPIDMEKLNQAVLGERGYYELVAKARKKNYIFRFNINAFRNGYNLTDLSKMKLIYYGIPVGKMELDKLKIENEFEYNQSSQSPSAEDIICNKKKTKKTLCDVFDIVLVGVTNE